MQNQNWRLFGRLIAVATLAVLVVSFTTLAVAQRIGARRKKRHFRWGVQSTHEC